MLWLDPVIAILIALYIMKEAWELGGRAFNNLMDREMPDDEKQRIIDIVKQAQGIEEMHALKTRYSGMKAFIQMHVGIRKEHSFVQAHDIADALEKALEDAFPGADIIIHQDPL